MGSRRNPSLEDFLDALAALGGPPCRNECDEMVDCEATSYGWMCMRNRGHAGPHVACGGGRNKHALHVWYDDDETRDKEKTE